MNKLFSLCEFSLAYRHGFCKISLYIFAEHVVDIYLVAGVGADVLVPNSGIWHDAVDLDATPRPIFGTVGRVAFSG